MKVVTKIKIQKQIGGVMNIQTNKSAYNILSSLWCFTLPLFQFQYFMHSFGLSVNTKISTRRISHSTRVLFYRLIMFNEQNLYLGNIYMLSCVMLLRLFIPEMLFPNPENSHL